MAQDLVRGIKGQALMDRLTEGGKLTPEAESRLTEKAIGMQMELSALQAKGQIQANNVRTQIDSAAVAMNKVGREMDLNADRAKARGNAVEGRVSVDKDGNVTTDYVERTPMSLKRGLFG